MNRRPLVAGALAAVAVASTGLLSACSSGQIAQTAEVKPGVAGVNLDAPGGRRVYIRDLSVAFNGPAGYAKGSNAPLDLWIFNGTQDAVTLSDVRAALQPSSGDPQQVDVVISTGGNTAAPCSVPASTAPTTAVPSPSPSSAAPSSPAAKSSPSSPAAKPSGKAPASAPASPSASPSPSPTPSPTVGSSDIHVLVPAGGCVELSTRAAHYLQLAGLPDALKNSDSVLAKFTFTGGDGTTFDVLGPHNDPVHIPVAVPDSPEPRQT